MFLKWVRRYSPRAREATDSQTSQTITLFRNGTKIRTFFGVCGSSDGGVAYCMVSLVVRSVNQHRLATNPFWSLEVTGLREVVSVNGKSSAGGWKPCRQNCLVSRQLPKGASKALICSFALVVTLLAIANILHRLLALSPYMPSSSRSFSGS